MYWHHKLCIILYNSIVKVIIPIQFNSILIKFQIRDNFKTSSLNIN